jgi:hypothetical protein
MSGSSRYFHDGTLTSPSHGVFLFNPLEDPVHHDPSRWIPSVAALVGDPDPNVHLNAVSILASFQDEEACLDAAIPLLPWLFEPKWANLRGPVIGAPRTSILSPN